VACSNASTTNATAFGNGPSTSALTSTTTVTAAGLDYQTVNSFIVTINAATVRPYTQIFGFLPPQRSFGFAW
jgi:hypothetical protein